ncbi:transcription factor 20 [Hoplias malabaricus]|uniref:transcription factor 20 n=1 Tax=Hoplias malabaricus TaxID=27720 RepID=UPI003461DA5D
MEHPPRNSDGLQPQEISSACNQPSVFDLTRNSEECQLKANSIEALQVVQSPAWYESSGTSNGMVLPVVETNHLPPPSDQIQPDNAFSNTTVTLSYVSKSHVFSTHNPLSEHSQIYGVPISKTFSLHPTAYDAAQLVTDTGGAPLCVEIDQHCLQQISVPVGLAACANSFEFVTPAQVVENVAGLYFQQAHDVSGIQDVESLALETLKSLQQSNPNQCKIPLSLDDLQNGSVSGLWEAGAFNGGFPAGHFVNPEDQQRNGNPEVLFLISRSGEPVILQNNPTGLAVSLNQDFISTLDHPVSPPVASLDEAKNVFILPQTAQAPSEEVDTLIEKSSTSQDELSKEESDPTTSVEETDSSSGVDIALGFDSSISSHLTGNNIDTCKPEQTEQSSNLSEVQEESTERCTLPNRDANVSSGLMSKKDILGRKELPPRTRRGKRLQAIVQNICPIRYRSSHVSSTKKLRCAKAQVDEAAHLGSEPEVSLDNSNRDVLEKVCAEEVVTKPNEKTKVQFMEEEEKEETGVTDLNSSESKISTSSSENALKHALDHTSPETLHKPIKYGKKSTERHKLSSKSPVRVKKQAAPPTQVCTKSSSKRQSHKGSPKAKKGHPPKRKRKTRKGGQSSIFSPQEPEIKLKYANYKDDRKEKRDETFAPFVHVELKAYPSCTIINYPDECERLNRGKQQGPKKCVSGAILTTPYLQHGRVSTDAVQQGSLVCCLCGMSANAMDLGDLHGPYYPEGFRPVSKTQANPEEQREEDSNDSDSTQIFNGNTHGTSSPASWIHEGHGKVRESAALETFQGWCSEGDLSCSPAAKRTRMDSVTDWYSPPIVPLEPCEYWLHEDCGIWSAGVFLVRGKLYGLEKAVKMAKETMCSFCQRTGATLGCFFKDCPNKYHYMCAAESGCVLNEDNFSMKCKKHKNKSIKGVSSNKPNSR